MIYSYGNLFGILCSIFTGIFICSYSLIYHITYRIHLYLFISLYKLFIMINRIILFYIINETNNCIYRDTTI